MIAYVLRRLGWSVLTVFGVMLITFGLFRGMAGDIAAAHLGQKADQQQRADWLNRHGYDKPMLLNLHGRLMIVDNTEGDRPLAANDDSKTGSKTADALALYGEIPDTEVDDQGGQDREKGLVRVLGRYVWRLNRKTHLSELTEGRPLTKTRRETPTTKPSTQPETTTPDPVYKPVIIFSLRDNSKLAIDLSHLSVKVSDKPKNNSKKDIKDKIEELTKPKPKARVIKIQTLARPDATCGDLLDAINNHPENNGRIHAKITEWSITDLLDSQFSDHVVKSVTFQARSLRIHKKLTQIIAERAPTSLALTVPAMAAGWFLAMVISSFVAYYRGTMLDKVGVFLSVLGMCIPFLAFMIYGQWLMFILAPTRAYGLAYRSNVYLPITIMVIAGLGGSVRFYRTVILDQVHQDYVRTARAKGASLPAVLFKHVLKNCMLPILTNLILSLPFLIMGSLLVETYFGIPGLGDLLLTSINGRDEPVVNAMVFLMAIVYTTGVMLADISYAIFDPRIRLT
jgi:peptide/nickel transport system permease protein